MEVEFTLDGEAARCPEGLTVAGALQLLGRRTMRITGRVPEPRSLFCGMGACHDCAVVIDGRSGVRACVTLVRPGMRVTTQHGPSDLAGRP